MEWIFSIILVITGFSSSDPLWVIGAGLFAIAGAISSKETHLKIENTIESKGRFNNE